LATLKAAVTRSKCTS